MPVTRILIFSQDPTLAYAKIVQAGQRWAADGAGGAIGSGFELRDESEVEEANYHNGLIGLTQIVDNDGNFAGRYLMQVPATLPESLEQYGVVCVGNNSPNPTIFDERSERGFFGWDGENVLSIANATTITVLPAQAGGVSAGQVSFSGEFTAYQYASIGPFIWAVFDQNNNPFDLTGKDLAIIAYVQQSGGALQEIFTLTTDSGDLTIDENEITIYQEANTNTQIARKLILAIRDLTDSPHAVLGFGRLTIPAVPDYTA